MPSLLIKLVMSAISGVMLFTSQAGAQERRDRSQYTAYAPSRPNRSQQTPNPSHVVTFSNFVLGADPDPNIRHQLLRDLGAKFGGPD